MTLNKHSAKKQMSKFHKIEKNFSFDSFECLQKKGLSRKIYFVPAKFMEEQRKIKNNN